MSSIPMDARQKTVIKIIQYQTQYSISNILYFIM